jgi:hypothetical protein
MARVDPTEIYLHSINHPEIAAVAIYEQDRGRSAQIHLQEMARGLGLAT